MLEGLKMWWKQSPKFTKNLVKSFASKEYFRQNVVGTIPLVPIRFSVPVVLKLLQSSSYVTIESVHTLMVENCVTFQDGLKFETLKRYVCTKHKHSLIFLPEKHCRSLSFTCSVMPCPFTGPKMFCADPNFFEPAQKFNCI